MFNLKRCQKNYLVRLFSEILCSWSVNFSQCCKCSMVTMKIHGSNSNGEVLLLLAAMLELALTMYALSSVFNVGLYLVCSPFCCQFTLILHVSANGCCLSCVTLTVFCVVLLLLFGTMYWDDVELPSLVGIVLLNCDPYCPFRAWMKKTDGVNLHMNKKSRCKWAGNNLWTYIAFCSFPILFSLLLLHYDVKSASSYLVLGLYPPLPCLHC